MIDYTKKLTTDREFYPIENLDYSKITPQITPQSNISTFLKIHMPTNVV